MPQPLALTSYKTFAQYLYSYRKSFGLNQQDIADSCGVSRQTIASLEAGKSSPNLSLATIILSYLQKEGAPPFDFSRLYDTKVFDDREDNEHEEQADEQRPDPATAEQS